MGPARSGGPVGVDPFGECPGNPKDGNRLSGFGDREVVITRRIRNLEKQLYDTQQELEELREIKKTPKAKLAQDLAVMTQERDKFKQAFLEFGEKNKALFREYLNLLP